MRYLTLSILLFFFSLNLGSAQYSERILNFHSDILVDTTSAITVKETIKVQANNIDIQRGIYRTLPTKRNIQEKTFYVKYNIKSVKKDGSVEPYHTAYENGNYVIYIGNKDVYLSSGIYEYEITYETLRQIAFFEEFDELYWNVTGNYWNFPIENASATIHFPKEVNILQNACYTGQYKSDANNCEVKINSPTSISWKSKNLGIGDGLTIAVGFSKGVIKEPELPAFLKTNNLSKILIGISGFLILLLGGLWFRYGIDPQKPTVVPQFEPPFNLSPAAIGFIKNGKYRHNLITASFVNLAIKGLITIKESTESHFFGLTKSTSYTLSKTKNDTISVSTEEEDLLNNMGSRLHINGTYDSKIASMVTTFKDRLRSSKKDLIHKGNNRSKIILPFLLISIVYWTIIIFSYFNLFNINKLIIGIVLYVFVSILYISIFSIPTLRYKSVLFWFWPLFPLIVLFVYWKYIDHQIEPYNLAYIFLITSLIILSFFKFLIEKPSSEFLNKKSLIQGFEMYLGAAENQQLKFHNPPQMTPERFEKLLPYAMVLGVDDIWGKKFDHFLQANNQEYKSQWFSGGMHGFTSNMSNSFNDGFSRSIGSSTIAPSDSGSGSGGGGFSGGGGGGGGGGGW